MKSCSKCKQLKSLDNFGKAGKYVASWCNKCRSRLEKDRRISDGIKEKKLSRINGETKLCLECGEFKYFCLFAKAKRGLGGLAAYCKECFIKRYPADKNKSKISVYKYRENNRERYLAQHRIHQFNRKSQIEVTNDGTVTDDFLVDLYATKICYICDSEITLKNRTADHVIPLSKGGKHSASNLKMACRKCNSSKGAKYD
jgi:hypothetical protein